jgi:hypothetical protein
MSLVITIYVREGIVMASDSRLTLNATQNLTGSHQTVNIAVGQSDSVYKTFLAPGNIGISTFGAADIKGVPITGFMESFINDHIAQKNISLNDVPRELLKYFRNISEDLQIGFHVAGYTSVNKVPEQSVWAVDVHGNTINLLNKPGQPGASWAGEADILARLINPVRVENSPGNFIDLPFAQIQFGYFTIQDAVDFAVYAIRTTIDSFRFQPRPKTVGGPIDILVIRPNEAFWVQRKELHV